MFCNNKIGDFRTYMLKFADGWLAGLLSMSSHFICLEFVVASVLYHEFRRFHSFFDTTIPLVIGGKLGLSPGRCSSCKSQTALPLFVFGCSFCCYSTGLCVILVVIVSYLHLPPTFIVVFYRRLILYPHS